MNMEKKKYVKPTMEVYEIKRPTSLLVGSPTEFGQLHTIPGQPDDEKQLA